MPNTNLLRIWSHLRQIAPLSGDSTKDAWFSLNLTPVLVEDPAETHDVAATAAQYLKPWTWQWPTVRLALIANGVFQRSLEVGDPGGGSAIVGQVLRETPIFQLTGDPANPATTPGILNLEFAATTLGFSETKTNPTQSANVQDPGSRDWKIWLLHASTFPGDIPLRTGLVVWFHLPYAQLAGIDEVVAAPIFNAAPFSQKYAPADPAAVCTNVNTAVAPCSLVRLTSALNPLGAGDTAAVTRWSYPAPAGADLSAEWIQPVTPLRTPGTTGWKWDSKGFIDESTFWIKPPSCGQGNDPHESLEQRIAGVFDLPLRLLEWADQALLPQPTSGIDANFGTAIVAAMRDLLQQTMPRPDQRRLLDDIAAVISSDAATQANLKQAVLTYYQTFTNYQAWIGWVSKALKQAFPNEFAPQWEHPPAAGSDFKPWLKTMHKAQAWLFDPANIRAFIENDWQQAIGASWTASAATLVDKYLSDLDLVTVLRLGFVGPAWAAQKGDWYAPTNLSGSVSTMLKNIYEERLGLGPTTAMGYQSLTPRSDGTSATQKPAIEAWLAQFVTAWSTSDNGPAPDPSATGPADYSRGNQGLNIQFSSQATLGGNGTADSVAEEQFLSTFRGALVAMRLAGQAWCILNLGQYSVRGEVDPAPGIPPAFNPDRIAVAPVQIGYRNGLRQVTCTYRNQPLGARSPLAALSKVRYFQGAPAGGEGYVAQPGVFELWNPYRAPGTFQIPRLAFIPDPAPAGTLQYEIAVGAVGLAGELPAELADPAKPWRVKSVFTPPDAAVQKSIGYLRTMPVGLVRVEGPKRLSIDQPVSKMIGPPIPDGVYPIVRSITAVEDQKDTVVLLCNTKDPKAAWIDGVLDTFSFWIRPPATDFDTFEACPLTISDTGNAPTATNRANVRSYLARKRDITNDQGAPGGTVNTDNDTRIDLTLDDPCVTAFSVAVSQLYPTGGPAGATKSASVVRKTPAAGDPLPLLTRYQSNSVQISFTVGAFNFPDFTPGAPWTISFPAGVWKIDIAPDFSANKNLLAAKLQTPGLRTFYVEVASSLSVPAGAAQMLNSALIPAPAFPPPAPDPLNPLPPLTVAMDLSKLGTLAPQIHRVELMIQRWRWQGKPLMRTDASGDVSYSFPYQELTQELTPVPPKQTIDQFLEPLDGVYFGERDSNDQLIFTAQVDSLAPAVPAQPQLYQYNLSSSPQALYYRFAVRVFSRYEGLMQRGSSVESRIVAGSPAEQWRRALPLCRRDRPAPKPIVRLIVPLTQTGSETTPGLLVVLDDTWYDWGGLAEHFQVQIDSVAKPDPAAPGVLQQIGPDPIFSNPNLNGTITFAPSLTPIGPIGFTFDTDTDAPLFGKTSFVIPAPSSVTVGGRQITDLSWWFIRLKFARSLDPAATLAPSGKLVDPTAAANLTSGWTDPIQAQFLPAANLWDISGSLGKVAAADLHSEFSGFTSDPTVAGAISILDSGGSTIQPLALSNPFVPAAPDKVQNRFEVWVLLTKGITDAFGSFGQEAFVDLVPVSKLSPYLRPAGKSIPNTVRLVEIQFMNDFSPQVSAWTDLATQLFPDGTANLKDPAMARARIVRVSPPIKASA